jgi:hypothetical protein
MCIDVELACTTPEFYLAQALWRLELRKRIVAALVGCNWAAVNPPDLPLVYPADSRGDEDLPRTPAPYILARVAAAVMTLSYLAP